MSLGFTVDTLLPKARGGGQLKMGLTKLSQDEWLQPDPDLTARRKAFADWPDGIELTPEAEAPGRELAATIGASGSLPEAALASHEDSDWRPSDKIGLPLRALHAPIAGYEEQLASGVDRFMETLKPGAIYGRCNWFIAATGARRWLEDRPAHKAFANVTPQNAGETLFVRSERQTLRRLPETGAIVFTIGIYVEPLGVLNPANIAMLAMATQNLVNAEGDRRGTPAYADALMHYAPQRSA